jgi:hypothetical protein
MPRADESSLTSSCASLISSPNLADHVARHLSRFSIAASTRNTTRSPPTPPHIPPQCLRLESARSTRPGASTLRPSHRRLRSIRSSLRPRSLSVAWTAEASRRLVEGQTHGTGMDTTRTRCSRGTSCTTGSCRAKRRRQARIRRATERPSRAPLGVLVGARVERLRDTTVPAGS